MGIKNVIYVEPNYIDSFNENNDCVVESGKEFKNTVYEKAPPLEDYCITVDLQVEVVARQSGQYHTNSKKIICSFTTKPKDNKGNVSFFEGKNMSFVNANSNVNYLTTEPTEFGTYDDAINYGTNECFGINSIDIMYNNYAIPEVTINFTDIRGISLFAPEELRHSETDENGNDGFIKRDVAGSFFKCFFTFPYPKFKLMVKGFYGEPTSYELCCSDFRANFDCNTGNFGATAKFVGYVYSLLNDVTMNALVVSPYSKYIGNDYWKNNLSDRFTIEDGKGGRIPMLTFIEILKKFKNLKKDYLKLTQTDPLSIQAKKLNDISQSITTISSNYSVYFNKVIDDIKKYYNDSDYRETMIVDSESYSFLIFSSIDGEDKDIDISCETEYNDLSNSISECKPFLQLPSPKKVEIKFSDVKVMTERIKKCKFIKNYGSKIDEYLQKKYVYLYDGSELIEKLNSCKLKNSNNVKANQKEIAIKKDYFIEKHLGFKPSVENITKILMAHFETLIRCIYNCSGVVNERKRKKSDLGLSSTDLNIIDDIVPPFPRVDLEIGNKQLEEGWIGDLPSGLDEEETYLIDGLLRGTNDVASIINIATKELNAIKGNEEVNTTMPIPITPIDIIADNKIFGDEIDFDNISDVIGRLGLRFLSIFGLNNYTNYSEIGSADAINFYNEFNSPSEKFLDRLYGGTFSDDLIIKVLFNSKDVENEKINGRWAWDSSNDEKSGSIMKMSNYNSFYSLYYQENNPNFKTILPIQNIKWRNIKNDLSNNNLPKSMEDYFITESYENKENKFVFFIDDNYEKYSLYENLIVYDEEKLSHVDSLKLAFNKEDFIDDYYEDDNFLFGRKLSYNNKGVSFVCGENSKLFPQEKPISREEAKNSKSFLTGNSYPDEFNTIMNYYEDKKSKGVVRKDGDITDAESEVGNVDTHTIIAFNGFENGEVSHKVSLFGQKEYYKQTKEVRALLFLMSFIYCDRWGYDYGCLNYEHFINDVLNENETNFMHTPKILVLLLGGALWRLEESSEPIVFDDDIITKKILELITYNYSYRKEVKTSLINYFKEWVDSSDGFKFIQSNFEIYNTKGKNVIDFIDEIKKYFGNEDNFGRFNRNVKGSEYYSFEDYIYQNINDDFYKNYISLKYNKNGLRLFNRETSVANNIVTNLVLTPCTVVKPTKFIFDNSNKRIEVGKYVTHTYFVSFIKKLKELYKEKKETSNSQKVAKLDSDNNIKITLYKYIKILWDRWLSGTNESDWNLENFYSNWYFIDSFYNKVGQKFNLNIIEFCSDIIYSQREYSYSLLSFISKAYAKNRFSFHSVQNFMDLVKGQGAVDKMNSLFKPIPYEKIKFDDIKKHPSFILMYVNEYSSKLDIPNSKFKSDSFNINAENDLLPKPIANKTEATGYKIPAFGVSYGKQYQSYFKNIDVNMDNPIATEQSIKSQFMIASLNGNGGENGKNIVTLGQDLYTIYSNNSYTCTVTMMGCAWIQPLMYFQLLNVPMFRGAYLIQKVSHKITPGNMETTFVGTRMSSTETGKVSKPIYAKLNDETDPQELYNDIKGNYTSPDNNCDYRYYNPMINEQNPTVSDEILDMNLSEYENYIGSKFNSIITEKGKTIIELLSGVVKKEAETEDNLGKELVATVLFNRYMHYGKNFTKMFYGKQHEIGYCDKTSSEDSSLMNLVREIFVQSPIILVGKETYVDRQVPIWNKGIISSELTKSKKITEHDIKSIDGYCTTNGYYSLDKEKKGNDKEESYGYWQEKSKYALHHQNKNISGENKYGHIFVSGAFSYDTEHWQNIKNENTVGKNGKINNLAKNLYNCLNKTLETSKLIEYNKIDCDIDKNVLHITAEPKKTLEYVFDILLNTYFDYIDTINWVSNNGSESPNEIRVIISDNKSFNRTISITNNNYKTINQYLYLNENFYKSLQKYFGEITPMNINEFKMTCKNFSELSTNEIINSSLIEKVNSILGFEIKDCASVVNEALSQGYTWDGDLKRSTNLNVKTNKISGYNKENAVNYAESHAVSDSTHYCAKYVREAMMNGGNADISSYPFSACAYSKYLPLWGFSEVYSGFSPITDGYTPQVGDIAVIAGRLDGKTSVHGHIQMYGNDGGWYSDFRANTVYCYSDKGRPFKIYRWNDTVKNDII